MNVARIVNAQGQLFDRRWASGLTHHSRTSESECFLVLRLVASTQKWIHQTEERVIREINSCESERLREGEREAQTGQEEMRAAMRADTPALEASQQYEPDAKGGEGKGGGKLILSVIPLS